MATTLSEQRKFNSSHYGEELRTKFPQSNLRFSAWKAKPAPYIIDWSLQGCVSPCPQVGWSGVPLFKYQSLQAADGTAMGTIRYVEHCYKAATSRSEERRVG